MQRNLFFSLIALVGFLLGAASLHAQSSHISIKEIDGRRDQDASSSTRNLLHPAVPLLSIAPDSRSAGMGDAGVASSPDANSQHWNLAKYAAIDKKWGVSLSYIPWLRKLTNDINLAYLAGYYRIDHMQAVSASLRYFSMGQMVFTDDQGQRLTTHNPNEFALDLGYSLKFFEGLTGGIAFRFIRSDLTGNFAQANAVGSAKAGTSYAADIALYYQKPLQIRGHKSEYAFGFTITNIGSKLSYNDVYKNFIPITMRLGGRWTSHIDAYNELSALVDASKLLIPTPPRYGSDSKIIKGMNPDVPVVSGMIQSFYDAPGGAAEEFHEVYWSAGLEYTYAKQFALRTGFFYEDQSKGGRQYFTLGAGVSYNVFTLDAAYLIPTAGFNSPMANTMRFSLMVNFAEVKKRKRDTKRND